MDSFGVFSGNDKEGGAGVENTGSALESGILTINRDFECTLPEALLIDVREGNERVGVELCLVKTSKRDLAIIKTIGNSGNLVRSDSLADQSVLRERLDRGQDALVGKGGLS